MWPEDEARSARRNKTQPFLHSLWFGREHTPWLRRVILVLFVVTMLFPATLVLVCRFLDPTTTPVMIGEWLSGKPVLRQWVPLKDISPNLVRAVIASEDQKFCTHDGFDWEAIDDALTSNAQGGRLRGASTISQQTAKNLFLTFHRTWLRKGFEAYFTMLMESFWPKSRIIEAYLNVAEWGHGRFGAEAASLYYFKKRASQLSPREAARLAAVLPNPNTLDASHPGPYVERRTAQLAAGITQVHRDNLAWCIAP